MSIQSTGIGKIESFWATVNGKAVLVDHILQTSLFTGVGIIGKPGQMVITAQAFRMLDEEKGMSFNPVGKEIQFQIEDPKSGVLSYSGVITNINKTHGVKQDTVILSFDNPKFVKLKNIRWWRTFEKTNILEIFKQFCNECGIDVNSFPTDHVKYRGTHWENFAIPMNGPTLRYLLEELKKDNFIFFSNPENDGIVVVNWSDLGRLDAIAKNHESFVVDQILAKFDQNGKEWKEETFTLGKQIDTHTLTKIQGFDGSFTPDITEAFDHQCVYYTPIKKPFLFDKEVPEAEKNDIGLEPENVEAYPGENFKKTILQPYPKLRNLISQPSKPDENEDYGAEWAMSSQSITFPRYMYYRMQQSYAKFINLIGETIVVPGSVKAIAPLTAVPVSIFENARVPDPNAEFPPGDDHFSGLFLIWGTKLSIVGNNALLTLSLVKPYQHK